MAYAVTQRTLIGKVVSLLIRIWTAKPLQGGCGCGYPSNVATAVCQPETGSGFALNALIETFATVLLSQPHGLWFQWGGGNLKSSIIFKSSGQKKNYKREMAMKQEGFVLRSRKKGWTSATPSVSEHQRMQGCQCMHARMQLLTKAQLPTHVPHRFDSIHSSGWADFNLISLLCLYRNALRKNAWFLLNPKWTD